MAASDSKPTLPLLLSVNAGYVDTAGFLALQGLFTAHITGNFVTFGASLALGTSGAAAKLLALPVFAAVVIAARLLDTVLSKRQMPALEALMTLHLLLLMVGAALGVGWGPFRDADSAQAVLTGMILVAAMALQNAFHRIHLGSFPPSTIMTGTTTQVMLDVADRLYAPERADSQSTPRLVRMSTTILVFALGCGAAALLYRLFGVKCFLVPPILAALQLIVRGIACSQSRRDDAADDRGHA